MPLRKGYPGRGRYTHWNLWSSEVVRLWFNSNLTAPVALLMIPQSYEHQQQITDYNSSYHHNAEILHIGSNRIQP